MNRPRGGVRASALLQKVSTQLKGERVPNVPKEEDELNAYLNTLSKKTAQQAKSINFSDFGDISISSSDNLSTPKQKTPEIGAGSKFLKKKKPPEPKSDEDEDSNQFRKKKTTSTTLVNKTAGLTKKEPISKQTSLLANQNVFSIDSDSDSEKVRLSRLDTPTDISIGHDGRKFMKRPETPKATKDAAKKTKKESSLKGVKEKNKKITSALTSEEDSLADFMQRLSSSESTPRPRSPNKFLKRPVEGAPPKPRSPSPESKPFRYTRSPRSPQIGRRTPSPLAPHSRSQDSDMVDSITSEVADTQDTSSSNDLFKDVMDINALEPAIPEAKKSKSKEKKLSFKKEKPKKEKKTAVDDIFFGLQSVDDLMGRVSDEEESIASEISEVDFRRGHTPTPRKDSLSGIQTFGSKPSTRKQISLSQDYDDSISEQIGISSKYDKSSIASEVRTQYSEDTAGDYTEGFDSDTESITETYTDRVPQSKSKSKSRREKDDDRSYSESYTSFTDSKTFSKSVKQSVQTSKHRPHTRSIQVQTGEEPGLAYSWKTPMATIGPQYGLDFVDPSPIATHVISADALETMTAYSPAMIALHDMLKQQLLLTQSFLSAQQRIYSNYQSSLENNHHYTTLEDTKQYIKQHRKKPITFKEAYKMVSAEMDS